MSLGSSDIKKIAHLARIAVSEEDIAAYTKELSRILDLVEQMSAVDTDDIEPMSHPLDVTQRLRPDEVTEPNERDELQKLAPSAEAGLYLVPRVIE